MPNIKVSPPSATSRVSPSVTKDVNNEKLMVALRVRPLRQDERSRGIQCVAEAVDNNMVILYDPQPVGNKKSNQNHLRKNRNNERQYVFDVAFGAESTQAEVYERTTRPLVESVLDGYNATVFAYGSTGSGKTHTMVGTHDNPGCMVRALNDIYEAMKNDTDNNFKVTMSYLEIYNENIRDLLNPNSGHLELRDDSKGKNIQVAGLSEVNTKSTEEVMRLLQRGNKERTTEPTAANKTSSRSHALLIVNVKQSAKSRAQTKGALKSGRLYMIDLAGSERAAQTENRGLRLKEGAHINRSLLALGNVINALAEQKTKHVNFRDSKLTRLLKDPLSGNCHTVMIAHVSPADKSRDESRNTLVYADRAKNISNKVRKNVLDVQYHVSQYQSIISELKGEIARLKEKMQFDESSGNGKPATGSKKIQEELKELREAFVYNFGEQMKLRHRIMEIDNHILSLSMEFEKQNIIITEWETERAKKSQVKKNSSKRNKTKTKKAVTETEIKNDEEEDPYKGDNEESGFEDNGSAIADDEDSSENADSKLEPEVGIDPEAEAPEEILVDEESKEEEVKDEELASDLQKEEQEGEDDGDESDDDDDDNDEDEDDDDDEDDVDNVNNMNGFEDEPEEVRNAWEELSLIQREQTRYTLIRMDLQIDLEQLKKQQTKLENELPKRISTSEEAEILQLLCKTHELEIAKVEMESNALLQQHEVRRRDLLLLKFDRQRNLMDEIIKRQRALIEANKNLGKTGEGFSMPMPPELMELYTLYQQELETRSENENRIIMDANTMMRAPSVLSLRGPEFDDKYASSDRLPPIRQESASGQQLFIKSRTNSLDDDPYERPESPRYHSVNYHGSIIPSLPPIGIRPGFRRSFSFVGSKYEMDLLTSDFDRRNLRNDRINTDAKLRRSQEFLSHSGPVGGRQRIIDVRFPSAPEYGNSKYGHGPNYSNDMTRYINDITKYNVSKPIGNMSNLSSSISKPHSSISKPHSSISKSSSGLAKHGSGMSNHGNGGMSNPKGAKRTVTKNRKNSNKTKGGAKTHGKPKKDQMETTRFQFERF